MIVESLREAVSALKLSLNPHSLLVFLDGLIWHPGMDLACTEEALILLRHLLEGDSTGIGFLFDVSFFIEVNTFRSLLNLSLPSDGVKNKSFNNSVTSYDHNPESHPPTPEVGEGDPRYSAMFSTGDVF